MLSDEYPERGVQSPLAHGGAGSFLHLHVANVDELTARAVASGAKGDRNAGEWPVGYSN